MHVRRALEIFEAMDPLQQTLMKASAGQCGKDSAHCSTTTVREVALMDCPGSMAHAEINEGVLYVPLCFTASASPTTAPSSRTSLFPSHAPADLLHYGTQASTPQDQSASSPGNAMRGDAGGGTDGDSMLTTYSSWL